MKRAIAGLLALILFIGLWPAASAEGFQPCHRVILTRKDIEQDNHSIIRLWTADTVLDSVDEELRQISQDYIDRFGPLLQPGHNKTSSSSILDLSVRYSRTGLSWLSFLVQARTSYHRKLVDQEVTSRTYDMLTGRRITLVDVFGKTKKSWKYLKDAIREQVSAYFPKERADTKKLDALLETKNVFNMAFTLHGMSLVLHIPADTLYPRHQTLMEVTLMYPDCRPYMTEEAQRQTDNLAYYKTCALTFDDGPSRTNTIKTMQSLMETGARGTFFIIGNLIQDNADIVQREHDEGHAIGAHNWHHGNVNKSSHGALRMMKVRFDRAIQPLIGLASKYDRVPYGLYPKMIKAKAGWPYIQWSVDTYDWRGRSSEEVLNVVRRQISDGDIILCHDIKENTPKSARMIAEYLEEHGYLLLTIDELFAKDGVQLKPHNVYFRCKQGDTSMKK